MKIRFLAALLGLALFGMSCSPDKPSTKRVVMLALDGISVEAYDKAELPNIDQLVQAGVLSLDTRNVMPSVTLPNWTSHLTGSGPEQHGVVNNGWEINNYQLPPVVKDAEGYYPSLFKVLKEQVPGMKTAFYYNWKNLIYPYNQAYFDEVKYLADDAYVPYYNQAIDFLKTNAEAPTCVFLYTVHTDHAGHKHGWMSDEFIASIEEADEQIGKFVQRLKAEGLFADTHFMFLSDHGGVNYGHGGVSESEMLVPWSICGPGIRKNAILQEPNNTVNTASIIATLFNCQQPAAWTGEVPQTIFE